MSNRLKPVSDQVIVITGASSGIGLVTARRAARQGAKVVLVARSGDTLARVVDEITAAGGTATHVVADVTDQAAVEAAATHAVERFGRIDTWVNNAGSAIYAKLLETPEEEHQRLFQTNYFGVVHGCLAAVPALADSGGALITVGSIASDLPSSLMGAYAATKHALKAYVEALRIELRQSHPQISVTLVKPAGIDTPIGQHAVNHEGGEAQIPPPAYDPDLVADAILHCAAHPKREITVGGAGRAQVLFAEHFPALFERLAPKSAKSFVDRTKTQPPHANLMSAGPAGEERSGEHPGRLRHSAYTAAMKHPGTTAAIGLGGLAVAIGVLFANGRKRT